jgi:Holliday junction DNA helicase RuvB
VRYDKQENILRPKMLKDFQGQPQIKENLSVYIKAAKSRHEPLDHTFLIVLRDWGKQPLRRSSPTRWVRRSG